MIISLLATLFFSHALTLGQPISSGSLLSNQPPLFASTLLSVPTPKLDTPITDTSVEDDTSAMLTDTMSFDATHGFSMKSHRRHSYLVTKLPDARQIPYMEPFTFIDFNRVTGFFLGLGTPGQIDFGRHDELGVDGGAGYGFASKRWEYRMNGEFRLPLGERQKPEDDTSSWKQVRGVPTLAAGAGFHNITSTDDAWRADKLENALDAFFAREDFRDYYKLAGWDAYLAFRPGPHSELRAEWRSDHYDFLSQNVFYGRFGGNKVLPPNRAAMPGLMNSLVLQAHDERVHTRTRTVTNIWDDTVDIEQLKGCSTLAQVELGHMPGSDFGFNRYLLDGRGFWPLFNGFNFDARFRYEATTGDTISQKLEYLGGPSSLPALYNKSIVGNRMMLLNTEIRLDLAMLSSFFHSPDLNIVIYNDFGKMGIAGTDQSILQGFQFSGASSILYNYGVGLGWTNGIQIGATWRTDIKADPRWIFRLQRAF